MALLVIVLSTEQRKFLLTIREKSVAGEMGKDGIIWARVIWVNEVLL